MLCNGNTCTIFIFTLCNHFVFCLFIVVLLSLILLFQNMALLVIQRNYSAATHCQITVQEKASLLFLGSSFLLLQVSRINNISVVSCPFGCIYSTCCVVYFFFFYIFVVCTCLFCRGSGRLQHELRPSAAWTQHPGGNACSCLYLVGKPLTQTQQLCLFKWWEIATRWLSWCINYLITARVLLDIYK